MAKEDEKEEVDRMTLTELPLNELKKCSSSSVASEARAELSASATAETENASESESPAAHVLSDIIIQRSGTNQDQTSLLSKC